MSKPPITNFARDPHEKHRVATSLELFFDLVYVVAIASAARGLHHLLGEHQIASGIVWYMLAFFAIWWCWMNYTWYASAYDTDDTAFRLITFIQIFGALVFAVGINNFFKPEHNLILPITGYVIMRLAMIIFWLRAARLDPLRKNVCRRYAAGIAFVQLLWVLHVLAPPGYILYLRICLVICELLVPIFAEKNYSQNGTPWHPHHIVERYSLLVIIVLGEGVLGTTNTIASLINSETRWQDALLLGFGAASLIFSLWWSYFKMPFGKILHQNKTSLFVSFIFGYGHFLIFFSLAAVGVGLQLVADAAANKNATHPVSPAFALMCVATAVGIYLAMMSFYRTILIRRSKYNQLSWLVAILLPALSAILSYMGMPLEWAICTAVIAPAAFIFLNSIDDCTNENAENFIIEK